MKFNNKYCTVCPRCGLRHPRFVEESHEVDPATVDHKSDPLAFVAPSLEHCLALLSSGWKPVRWEHADLGVHEFPPEGGWKRTSPDGVVQGITKDGLLFVSAPNGGVIRGGTHSLQKR